MFAVALLTVTAAFAPLRPSRLVRGGGHDHGALRPRATLLHERKVLVTGGVDVNLDAVTASAEVYDPASNTWSEVASMNTPRIGHTATVLPNGKVLVTGGGTPTGLATSAEVYDPESDTWSLVANMGTGAEEPHGHVVAERKGARHRRRHRLRPDNVDRAVRPGQQHVVSGTGHEHGSLEPRRDPVDQRQGAGSRGRDQFVDFRVDRGV